MNARGIALLLVLAACGDGDDAPDLIPRIDAAPPTSDVAFEPARAYAGEVDGPGRVAVGDATGDGRADLVFAFGPRYAVFPGLADGTLGDRDPRSLGQDDATDVAAGDGAVVVGVLREFGTAVRVDDGVAPREHAADATIAALELADIDGDGDADAVAHVGDAVVMYDATDGAFARVELPNAALPAFVEIADVDGDGTLDIIANGPGGSIYVALAASPGAFETAVAVDALNPLSLDAVAGDFSGDGATDIAVIGVDRVRVLVRTSASPLAFAPADHGLVLGAPATGADIDGDGRVDIVAATPDGTAVALRDRRAPTELFVHVVLGDGPGDVATGDLDGDGRVDVIVADGDGASVFAQSAR